MKIQLVSDLHLEFGTITLENNGADILILSGDICVAQGFTLKYRELFLNFFNDVCSKFKEVIYVLGNHEHYNGDFALTETLLKEELEHLLNLHILEKKSVTIDDVMFIGATIWTDMNKNDPNTLWEVRRRMNDFRIIRNTNSEYGLLDPSHVVNEHFETLSYIQKEVDNIPQGKVVVVGHHAPSRLSLKPRYERENLINGAYSSELSEFILDRPQIKLWTHGHTHDSFDYMIGSTRVVCNPRGYASYEVNKMFNPNLVIEI